jgi:hypothetical protein
MIEAKDLRIDNLLISSLTGEYVKADWLVIKHVTDGNVQSVYDDRSVYEPILLTEEILIKAGFEPNGVYKSMRLPVNELSERCRVFIVVSLNPSECWIEMIDKRTNDKYEELQSQIIKLSGVHQLQNIFYSLTGEELTINL